MGQSESGKKEDRRERRGKSWGTSQTPTPVLPQPFFLASPAVVRLSAGACSYAFISKLCESQ